MSNAPQAEVRRIGEGLPLVMVHGNGVDHRLLLPLEAALDIDGLERLYFDLPGFGQTPALPEPGGLPELAEWLVGHVRGLVGDQPFALLGNSLGGLLVRHLRAQFPGQVCGIAMLAPVVDPVEEHRRQPEFRVLERDDALLSSLDEDDREVFTEMAARQTRPGWEIFSEFIIPGIRSGDSDAFDRLGERYVLPDPDQAAGPCEGPALIVTGRQDHIVGYEDQFALLKHYPNATYAALHACGHNVHVDQPELTRELVRSWAHSLLTD